MGLYVHSCEVVYSAPSHKKPCAMDSKSKDSRARFEPWFYPHVLPLRPWTSYLPSLCHGIFNNKMEMIITTSKWAVERIKCVGTCEFLEECMAHSKHMISISYHFILNLKYCAPEILKHTFCPVILTQNDYIINGMGQLVTNEKADNLVNSCLQAVVCRHLNNNPWWLLHSVMSRSTGLKPTTSRENFPKGERFISLLPFSLSHLHIQNALSLE